jgi:hypothetical protein
LSTHSIWDPANELQQQRVRDWLLKEKSVPEIYFYHAAVSRRLTP